MKKQFPITIFILGAALVGLMVGMPVWANNLPDAANRIGEFEGSSPFVENNVHILYQYDGELVAETFGWVGANLGDMNNDGANEYAITAPFYPATPPYSGRVFIYNGSDGSVINTVNGDPGNVMGYSAAAAGDVNNDDVPDYILGGQASFAAQTPGRVLVLSGANHSVLYDKSGPNGFGFGSAVAGGIDANDDGYDDFIVGSQYYSSTLGMPSPDGPGRVEVYSGIDGSLLWFKDGLAAGDWLGAGVGSIGDVNNDGIGEVVVSARGAAGGSGQAYILSGADGSVIHTLNPTTPVSSSTTFGQFFTRGAGDVNNDGWDDVFIGDYFAYNGNGRAYVFSGFDGQPIHVFDADNPGDGLGPGRGVPDVNHDGYDDVVIAAYTSNEGATNGGKVTVYSGADASPLYSFTGAVANDALGVDALPLGDLDNDGLPEFMLTATGLDFGGVDVGHVYIVSYLPGIYLPYVSK
ncbi:MAG: hypothetical protein WAM60_11250 [Candidatus Promineifilaceae bacterium]